MKLYKISQTVNDGYDTYSDAIVCASSEDEARRIHPSCYDEGEIIFKDEKWVFAWDPDQEIYSDNWAHIDDVEVVFIGEADASITKGVVLSSFHAG